MSRLKRRIFRLGCHYPSRPEERISVQIAGFQTINSEPCFRFETPDILFFIVWCPRTMEIQILDDENRIETSEVAGLNTFEVQINEEPYEGMLFESEKSARDFYDEYASRAGFVTRVLSSRKSERDGSIISRGVGCRGGSYKRTKVKFEKQDPQKSCTAMILLKRESTGSWIIRKFIRDHNHPLVVHFPKNRRALDEKDKKIQELTAELRVKKRLSAQYREQLLTFMKDVEDHGDHLSKKVHSVYENIKNLEANMEKLS
ncbi:hypothetical protein L6164_019285 [Bauhinia variegata]|uniref:Uncharacterized protein n=1 Tax=Bauhinia variegata TaxID=167791 RepID=A0ACB9NER8_BAUVA|nr:hypothetical protein L6164_019285 [Bauhinia variegata]